MNIKLPFLTALYKQAIAHAQLLTYLFVGLSNTLLTLSVIFVMLKLDYNYLVSNALGYTAGMALSFFLNSRLTFKASVDKTRAIKYIVALAMAYLGNILIVYKLMRIFFGYPFLIQLAGILFYTACGFLLNKYWVFKE